MKTATTEPAFLAPPVRLRRGLPLRAPGALFGLAVARSCRGRRLLILGLIFALPVVFAALERSYNPSSNAADAETALVLYMIPHAVVPLTALVFAAGMIQDEVEDQTLTYLLVRPLPRWSIYVTKFLAALMVAAVLTALCTTVTEAVIHWGRPEAEGTLSPVDRAARTTAILALALSAYVALFGFLGIFVKQALALGVAYIIFLEGVVANIGFAIRQVTVMYYYRVLCARWLDRNPEEWSIALESAPSARECVLTLLGASVVLTALAAFAFAAREWRVKTPEGS